MKGGQANDFIDAFSYQSVAVIFKGEKYFSDGITSDANGRFSFFVIKVDENGELLKDVYDFESNSVPDCISAFESAPIWDGRTFWEAEQEMEWVDC